MNGQNSTASFIKPAGIMVGQKVARNRNGFALVSNIKSPQALNNYKSQGANSSILRDNQKSVTLSHTDHTQIIN